MNSSPVNTGFNLRNIRKRLGKRGESKLPQRPTMDQIIRSMPWDTKPLPYYSAVPEERWRDNPAWAGLSWQDKGIFLILVDWIWMCGGFLRQDDLAGAATAIGIDPVDMHHAIARLEETGFIHQHDGKLMIVELREQQLTTRDSHINHINHTAPVYPDLD